jgi:hypothetical protein
MQYKHLVKLQLVERTEEEERRIRGAEGRARGGRTCISIAASSIRPTIAALSGGHTT